MSATQPIPGSTIDPKFAAFTITDVTYKHVNGVPIEASILIPNDLQPGKYPVTVRWHGGGFGTGHRLFAPWYGDWNLSLTLRHSAIAVVPDYRLLPEARGLDVLADCTDFFRWLHTPGRLAAQLPAGLEPDFSRGVLVTGESAGGWLAVQSGFVAVPPPAAVVAPYPMLDLAGEFWTVDGSRPVPEGGPPFPWPRMEPRVVREYVRGLKGDEVVPNRMPPEGLAVTAAMCQRGLMGEYFGTEEVLLPVEMLGKVEAYPPLWIFHGDADCIVPVDGTETFVAKFKERFPDGELHLSIREGEDHGFDNHEAETGGAPATLEREWVKAGVEFVERFWPKV